MKFETSIAVKRVVNIEFYDFKILCYNPSDS